MRKPQIARPALLAAAALSAPLTSCISVKAPDKPIDINPDRIDPRILGLAAYVKPSVGLQLLRQEIMGPEAFDDAFRTYIQRWAYKHPTPADFFRTMQDAGGKRLGLLR